MHFRSSFISSYHKGKHFLTTVLILNSCGGLGQMWCGSADVQCGGVRCDLFALNMACVLQKQRFCNSFTLAHRLMFLWGWVTRGEGLSTVIYNIATDRTTYTLSRYLFHTRNAISKLGTANSEFRGEKIYQHSLWINYQANHSCTWCQYSQFPHL